MEIFDLVDLRVNFSAELLHSFYEECVVPSFGMFKDELESEADWRDRLLEDEQKARFLLHIVLAVHKETRVAMGGLVFEYYKQSNCGLYTYAAASPNYRGKGFAKFFIDKVLEIVNTDAQKYHGRNCDAVFIECNDPNKVAAEEDAMIPMERIRMFAKMGYRFLDFPYVQPALSEEQEKCHDLVLGVHQSFLTHNEASARPQQPMMASKIIRAWIEDFYVSCNGDWVIRHDPEYKKLVQHLQQNDFVPVISAFHPPMSAL
eukprot:TRINITY_DN2129_c0_g4_i1.p1 TRINITY_DN2129_c0_g4~~TRINITY_DN2129_c0_g4_i1.p1  ORF type:complete len:260 (-),score=69.12 TRINITY_DN2129_c0_g4_i1:161-940(-)